MSRITPEQIIAGIKERDDTILRFVYKSHYSTVLNFIMNNNGTEEDAQDIFQESLITVYKSIRDKPDFELKCTFQTYIYSIARLLWLKQLRKNRSDGEIPLVDNLSYIHFEEPEPFREEDHRYAAYQKAFLTLPSDCREILKMTIDGFSQKEIVDALGLTSENYIRKRKHFCKEFLIKKIKEDPQFKEDDA